MCVRGRARESLCVLKERLQQNQLAKTVIIIDAVLSSSSFLKKYIHFRAILAASMTKHCPATI